MALPQKKSDNKSLKRLLLVIFLGILFFIGYKIYYRYSSYHAIERFDYPIAKQIDENYYDQAALYQYKNDAVTLSKMARELWIGHRIDVLKPDANMCKKAYPDYLSYKILLEKVKATENNLISSKELKDTEGLNNASIEAILKNDFTIGAYYTSLDARHAYDFLKGKNVNKNSAPAEVWELQKLLNYNDYTILIDGKYNTETDSALTDFQQNNNLFPSHSCNDITLDKMIK